MSHHPLVNETACFCSISITIHALHSTVCLRENYVQYSKLNLYMNHKVNRRQDVSAGSLLNRQTRSKLNTKIRPDRRLNPHSGKRDILEYIGQGRWTCNYEPWPRLAHKKLGRECIHTNTLHELKTKNGLKRCSDTRTNSKQVKTMKSLVIRSRKCWELELTAAMLHAAKASGNLSPGCAKKWMRQYITLISLYSIITIT